MGKAGLRGLLGSSAWAAGLDQGVAGGGLQMGSMDTLGSQKQVLYQWGAILTSLDSVDSLRNLQHRRATRTATSFWKAVG